MGMPAWTGTGPEPWWWGLSGPDMFAQGGNRNIAMEKAAANPDDPAWIKSVDEYNAGKPISDPIYAAFFKGSTTPVGKATVQDAAIAKNEWDSEHYNPSAFVGLRNGIEAAGVDIGNYLLPGSALVTSPLSSKGAKEMNNPYVTMAMGAGGGADGQTNNWNKLYQGVTGNKPITNPLSPGATDAGKKVLSAGQVQDLINSGRSSQEITQWVSDAGYTLDDAGATLLANAPGGVVDVGGTGINGSDGGAGLTTTTVSTTNNNNAGAGDSLIPGITNGDLFKGGLGLISGLSTGAIEQAKQDALNRQIALNEKMYADKKAAANAIPSLKFKYQPGLIS